MTALGSVTGTESASGPVAETVAVTVAVAVSVTVTVSVAEPVTVPVIAPVPVPEHTPHRGWSILQSMARTWSRSSRASAAWALSTAPACTRSSRCTSSSFAEP